MNFEYNFYIYVHKSPIINYYYQYKQVNDYTKNLYCKPN